MRVAIFVFAFLTFVFSWVMMAWAFEVANGGTYAGTATDTAGHNPTLALVLFGLSLPVSIICMWIPSRMMRD